MNRKEKEKKNFFPDKTARFNFFSFSILLLVGAKRVVCMLVETGYSPRMLNVSFSMKATNSEFFS